MRSISSLLSPSEEHPSVAAPMKLIVLTYVYNDWPSYETLMPLIDVEFDRAKLEADMLLVDDGSTETPPQCLISKPLRTFRKVNVLKLHRNMGAQRAIAVGLCHIYQHLKYDAVLIMDADGEDRPEDAVRLIRKLQSEPTPSIIFAERSKRSESALFILFYHLYRLLHFLLTGRGIRVGNFSIVPYSLLGGIVVDVNLWNHYAASVWMSRVRRLIVPSSRGKRFHGRSKLGFTALVVHGLSAISCYGELISVRLLFCSSAILCLLLSAVAVTVAIRLFTNLAIPGWATYTVGILVGLAVQVVLLSALFATTLLNRRIGQPFIPLRDYHHFAGPLRQIYPYES